MENNGIKYKDESWDFRTSFTKYSNHGFHTYPFKKAYGIDINPLALLISKVKTTPINPEKVEEEYKELMSRCNADRKAINFRQKKIEKYNQYGRIS